MNLLTIQPGSWSWWLCGRNIHMSLRLKRYTTCKKKHRDVFWWLANLSVRLKFIPKVKQLKKKRSDGFLWNSCRWSLKKLFSHHSTVIYHRSLMCQDQNTMFGVICIKCALPFDFVTQHDLYQVLNVNCTLAWYAESSEYYSCLVSVFCDSGLCCLCAVGSLNRFFFQTQSVDSEVLRVTAVDADSTIENNLVTYSMVIRWTRTWKTTMNLSIYSTAWSIYKEHLK